MTSFTARGVSKLRQLKDVVPASGSGDNGKVCTFNFAGDDYVFNVSPGGSGIERIQDATDLNQALGAEQHGHAVVWLWDENTGTGSFAVKGNLIFIDPPSDLVATPISYTEIELTWTNNSPIAFDFLVFVSIDNFEFQQHDTASGSPWSDFAIVSSPVYYKIAAYIQDEATGNLIVSAFSDVATATIPDPIGVTNLAGEVVGANIHLTWDATLDAFCTGLSVRRINSGDEQVIGFLASDAVEFTDVDAPAGDNEYHILAVGAVNSTDSDHITVTI